MIFLWIHIACVTFLAGFVGAEVWYFCILPRWRKRFPLPPLVIPPAPPPPWRKDDC